MTFAATSSVAINQTTFVCREIAQGSDVVPTAFKDAPSTWDDIQRHARIPRDAGRFVQQAPAAWRVVGDDDKQVVVAVDTSVTAGLATK